MITKYKNIITKEEKIFYDKNEAEHKEFTKKIFKQVWEAFIQEKIKFINKNLSIEEKINELTLLYKEHEDQNWNKYSTEWKICYREFEDEELIELKKQVSESKNSTKKDYSTKENTHRKNKKVKSVGNGDGSLYFSETLKCWVFQYWIDNKRKTLKQKKDESARDFKLKVTKLKNDINNGTYIAKSNKSLKEIIEKHIHQKFNDGITRGNSHTRDKYSLIQLSKCCEQFIEKPIQKVSLDDIQSSKENMKKHSQSDIDKMWRLLKKGFAIASSPSVGLINVNIMNDENLNKPISEKETKKVFPLTVKEREKLLHILDVEERNHKYRNIVKLEWLTAMRIGEVLARSKDDINKERTKLHIHNTLTKDEDGNTIIGEHTKTYNKQTGIDEGERYFPISKEIEEILDEQTSSKLTTIHNLLFWDYEENCLLTDNKINSWLRRINEKYKISSKSLHNHRLRHDRITQWKELGMDIKAIQYLAGHVEGSDITNEYIDISRDFAFSELEKAK